MQNLPEAAVYELEFKYMPWGKLINEVRGYIGRNVMGNGTLLDMMCGPGYLLSKLNYDRPDINFTGVDLDPEFIQHARGLCPGMRLHTADALTWKSEFHYDAVICTAGVHHLPDKDQDPFIAKLATLVNPRGFAIIADPYIGNYNTPRERQLAGAKLGHEYLLETIRINAPTEVIAAAVQLIHNDVLGVEWKTSAKNRLETLKKHFKKIEPRKTWPTQETDWGDYYFVVSN